MNLDLLETVPPAKKLEWIARLRWREQAHPHQIPPPPGWDILLVVTGRGAGKTRGAAQQIAERMIDRPGTQWAVVAPTWRETRGICLAGPSGIRRALRDMGYEPEYHKSDGILSLPNGSAALGYSSEKPDRLRGPEHHGAWCDELAVWKDAHPLGTDAPDTTWSNLRLGLRLGDRTETIVTTTPKRVQLLRDLIDAGHPLQRASSMVNIANLSGDFREYIESLQGTSLGRQEVEGIMLDTVEGALWKDSWFNRFQPKTATRTVVGVDPSGGRPGTTGIVVARLIVGCGCGKPGDHGHIVEDASTGGDPLTWAQAVVEAARRWDAEIVAERNYGGEMVETTIRQVWAEAPLRLIVAAGGGQGQSAKAFRAEPVAALYEAGRIHHAPGLVALEDQLTGWVPSDKWSPDRLDALVHAVTALGLTKQPQTVVSRGPWQKRNAVTSETK